MRTRPHIITDWFRKLLNHTINSFGKHLAAAHDMSAHKRRVHILLRPPLITNHATVREHLWCCICVKTHPFSRKADTELLWYGKLSCSALQWKVKSSFPTLLVRSLHKYICAARTSIYVIGWFVNFAQRWYDYFEAKLRRWFSIKIPYSLYLIFLMKAFNLPFGLMKIRYYWWSAIVLTRESERFK